MSYTVVKQKREYVIMENNELRVTSYLYRKLAIKICRGLNLGNGFDNNTPSFFGSSIVKNGYTPS
jgi:hypothetical protein